MLQERIDSLRTSLAAATSSVSLAGADPQATVLANLSGPDETMVETALTVLVAILVELGSSLGMFVAFSMWKLQAKRREEVVAAPAPTPVVAGLPATPSLATTMLPEDIAEPDPDTSAEVVEFKEFVNSNPRKASAGMGGLTMSELDEAYSSWCGRHSKPAAMRGSFRTVARQADIKTQRINCRLICVGLAWKVAPAIEKPHRAAGAFEISCRCGGRRSYSVHGRSPVVACTF